MSDNFHLLLLDTEGLGSFNRQLMLDTKIFTLSLLLSSYFIYNSMTALDETALESLSLVVHLTKYIHVKTQPSNVEEDPSAFSTYFPFFMWVVRDFALRLIDSQEHTVHNIYIYILLTLDY